jgi:hypothetical protein
MSVSLREVIESAGYYINTEEDARWLLSKQSEFEDLIEQSQSLINKIEDEENALAEKEYKKTFPTEEE